MKQKFRTWSTRDNSMVDIQFYASFDTDGSINVAPWAIAMQSTGLYDADNQEIFEDDLLICTGMFIPYRVVRGKYGWCIDFKGEIVPIINDLLSKLYIAGNFHEFQLRNLKEHDIVRLTIPLEGCDYTSDDKGTIVHTTNFLHEVEFTKNGNTEILPIPSAMLTKYSF